jgi:hypothetical protein
VNPKAGLDVLVNPKAGLDVLANPKAGLDVLANRTFAASVGNRSTIPQPPKPQRLYYII